ncbi:recombinase family protein [Lacisediminihabitans profunda]|uniref:Recombinase family protein n=1 Tax=Lacisediminihabitans profunda TaxID=2594790 RepID=A0A5C8UIW2_9MICO|nr:recombinase family protein [Lacisediminihabitans profunda]TXN27946.1 recombinase family protein [Lacisediminihabitans profunda]
MVETVRAAIYARISRDVTGEGLGVERQLADCRKIAADRGWLVAEEYVDNDISAFAGKRRPSYERMLEDIAAGQRDAVIVYNTDRLTRRPIELEQFTGICEVAGVRQLVAVTGDIDLGNDDGMFMARVLAAVAAKESGRKSERLKRKARENAEAGKPNGGIRPFGYEKDQITVVESEAAVIRQLAERYLAGESMGSLTRWIQDQGIPTVAGAAWHTSTVRSVLRNPRIAGLRAHNGVIVGPAMWPAIISPEQHRQLLAAFARKVNSGRRTPRSYLLSGMLRCGNCGNKLFSAVRGDTRRYVCQSGPDHGGCGRLTIVAGPVEEWIAEAVLIRLDSPAMADALAGRAAADDRFSALSAELQSDQAQLKELAEEWAAKGISMLEWKAAREPIEARIYNTDRQLGQLSGNSTLSGLVGNGDGLRANWESLNLSRQVAIIGAVLDYATITPAKTRGREFDPFRIVPTWSR